MRFKEEIAQLDFCKKYGCKKRGGIRLSSRYPFIFLISNYRSHYADDLDVNKEGTHSLIHFQARGYNKDNRNVIKHKNLNGVYHSIFMFERRKDKLFYIGEYDLEQIAYKENQEIEYFVLKKVYRESLDHVKVFFVEKTEPVVYLSELGDRSDVINGVYDDELIEAEIEDGNIREGDFLDANYNRIYSLYCVK